MAKNFVYIGIAVLALIAVVLGYKIYQQKLTSTLPQTNQSTQNRPTTPTSVNQATPGEAQTPSVDLGEQERLVKSVPLPTAPLEARIAFNDQLKKYEKETGTIEITNCKPLPLIFRVKGETSFSIKNNDAVEYKISVGGQKITLAPNSMSTMMAGKADGVTDISCNGGVQGLVHFHQ